MYDRDKVRQLQNEIEDSGDNRFKGWKIPMTEFTCPTVAVKIAGHEFVLRMDFNALALAEKTTGKNFLDPDLWQKMDVTTATALFWACAVQTDTKLTLGAVRSLGYKHIRAIIEACRNAWKAANEIAEEDARPINGSEQKSAAVLAA
jgi:hypothetical protein